MELRIGSLLHGYCDGLFGRDIDPNGALRVEAVGADWIVAREVMSGNPLFIAFRSAEVLENYVAKWIKW
jgi:hypothetical protein